MSTVKEKIYKCKLCGKDDPKEFYESKGRIKCKSCIIGQNTRSIKHDIDKEISLRLESLNSKEMEDHPDRFETTWRKDVERSMETTSELEFVTTVLSNKASDTDIVLYKCVKDTDKIGKENEVLTKKVNDLEKVNDELIKRQEQMEKDFIMLKDFCRSLHAYIEDNMK